MPVFNEQAALERSIRRLHRFLSAELPFSWRIVIADNASTDATPAIAAALAHELPGVEVLRLDRKGRGLALREAWSRSDARVLCYMDVDLSTDLRGLLPLVAPLLSGHSDVAIGTRLARSARVVRGAQARAHLALLQPPAAHRAARALLRRAVRLQGRDGDGGPAPARRGPRRRLVLRHRAARARPAHAGCASTRSRSTGSTTPTRASTSCAPRSRTCAASRAWRRPAPWRASWASACSARSPTSRSTCCCTATLGAGGANAVALALTAVANTAANRRLTFGVRGRERLLHHHARGAVVYVLTLGLTTLALASLHRIDPSPSRARRAGGARRRGRGGDRHPLPGPAHVGLRPRAGGQDGSRRSVRLSARRPRVVVAQPGIRCPVVSERDVRLADGRVLRVHDAAAAAHGAFTIVWHHGSPQTGAPLAPLVTAASERGIRLLVLRPAELRRFEPRPGRDVASAARRCGAAGRRARGRALRGHGRVRRGAARARLRRPARRAGHGRGLPGEPGADRRGHRLVRRDGRPAAACGRPSTAARRAPDTPRRRSSTRRASRRPTGPPCRARGPRSAKTPSAPAPPDPTA